EVLHRLRAGLALQVPRRRADAPTGHRSPLPHGVPLQRRRAQPPRVLRGLRRPAGRQALAPTQPSRAHLVRLTALSGNAEGSSAGGSSVTGRFRWTPRVTPGGNLRVSGKLCGLVSERSGGLSECRKARVRVSRVGATPPAQGSLAWWVARSTAPL